MREIIKETIASKKFWIKIGIIYSLFMLGMIIGRVGYEIKTGNDLGIGKLILYAFMRMGVE